MRKQWQNQIKSLSRWKNYSSQASRRQMRLRRTGFDSLPVEPKDKYDHCNRNHEGEADDFVKVHGSIQVLATK
jgi:glyoxylate carboligase